MLIFETEHRRLHFKQPAGTSRGVYTTRDIWLVRVHDSACPEVTGIGECAPLPDLSCDASPDYASRLASLCLDAQRLGEVPYDEGIDCPSMLFGIETALLNLKRRSFVLSDTPFGRGEEGIPINGLVWMGSYEEMLARIEEKLSQGFSCVKLKIGAIDFEKEIDLLRIIRERFPADKIQLRVDANGAFSPSDAMRKLEILAKFDIHSIEQPIRQGQIGEMARLCAESPIPVALDEEMIGINDPSSKRQLLDRVRPSFIVIKPSLHGGFRGTREWVALAAERGIGSWITSALESNIGLNAVAHLAAEIYGPQISMPQGLGTGQLFTDNISLPYDLVLEGGMMKVHFRQ